MRRGCCSRSSGPIFRLCLHPKGAGCTNREITAKVPHWVADKRSMSETLLASIWAAEGSEEEALAEILEKLESGELLLAGNFKGAEAEMAAGAREGE